MAGIARSVPPQRTSGRTRLRAAVRRRDDGHDRQGAVPGAAGATPSSCSAWRVALAGERGIWALAGDTDGIDGTEDAAGAIVTPGHPGPRARLADSTPRAMLAGHDSYSLFAGIGDLIRTGPTCTNVNDIRAILITRGGRQAE